MDMGVDPMGAPPVAAWRSPACTRPAPVDCPPVPHELPLPPEEMRALVGVTDPALFDNPEGSNALPEAGERAYGAVFDFGCGCGRLARRLMQQQPPPARYVGIDLHAGMIRWCNAHLAPLAPQFSFVHHDVYNAGFNPGSPAAMLDFPVEDGAFDVVVAHSVFTHVIEEAALHYLAECARILSPGGALVSTWFLFDKRPFPMMQSFQNALYINTNDPSNAVIFDREWLRAATAEAGLVVTAAWPPAIRGFHWTLRLEPAASGALGVELPEDEAPLGSLPPPVLSVPAHTIGA
jgi:SAM-dependent methyltransferase